MKKTVLLTGGTGQLGANLILYLIKQKFKVKVLLRKDSYHPYLEKIKIEKVWGDLLDFKSLVNAIKGCEIIIHAAGFISYKKKDFKKLYDINFLGTKYVLKAALFNKVKIFIHISSTAAIGYSLRQLELNENEPFNYNYNKIGYMYTKYLAEQYIMQYKDRLKVISLNPGTIVGKGDNHFNTGEVFFKIKNKQLKIAPPGGNTFVDVEDVVNAVFGALKRGKTGERYIISNQNITLLDYFNFIAKAYNIPKIKKSLPWVTKPFILFLSRIIETLCNLLKIEPVLTSELIEISYAFRYFDSTKAHKQLGWEPTKDIKSSIKEAIQFYNSQKMN